jgi:hypothetical protein
MHPEMGESMRRAESVYEREKWRKAGTRSVMSSAASLSGSLICPVAAAVAARVPEYCEDNANEVVWGGVTGKTCLQMR